MVVMDLCTYLGGEITIRVDQIRYSPGGKKLRLVVTTPSIWRKPRLLRVCQRKILVKIEEQFK